VAYPLGLNGVVVGQGGIDKADILSQIRQEWYCTSPPSEPYNVKEMRLRFQRDVKKQEVRLPRMLLTSMSRMLFVTGNGESFKVMIESKRRWKLNRLRSVTSAVSARSAAEKKEYFRTERGRASYVKENQPKKLLAFKVIEVFSSYTSYH
jgi:hypothetical protein